MRWQSHPAAAARLHAPEDGSRGLAAPQKVMILGVLAERWGSSPAARSQAALTACTMHTPPRSCLAPVLGFSPVAGSDPAQPRARNSVARRSRGARWGWVTPAEWGAGGAGLRAQLLSPASSVVHPALGIPELQRHTRTQALTAAWGAMCWDISFSARSCRTWKDFAKPPRPTRGEARAEEPGPGLDVPPMAPAGDTQKPFPKRTTRWQHQPHQEGATHSKTPQRGSTALLRGTAQPQLPLPGTGTVQQAWVLLGPIPSHGARAGEPRGKRQVTTILRGSTGEEGTGRETVYCQIPASDLRNFQTTSSIMDAREGSAVRAAAGPGPTNSYSTC